MFDIITNYTIEDSEHLKQLSYSITDVANGAESARSVLGSMSGMEGIVSRLRAVIDDIYDEAAVTRLIGQSLEKISYLYCHTENNICDNAEENVVRYCRWHISSVDLSAISKMLED